MCLAKENINVYCIYILFLLLEMLVDISAVLFKMVYCIFVASERGPSYILKKSVYNKYYNDISAITLCSEVDAMVAITLYR